LSTFKRRALIVSKGAASFKRHCGVVLAATSSVFGLSLLDRVTAYPPPGGGGGRCRAIHEESG
jgi:hypothetical protein